MAQINGRGRGSPRAGRRPIFDEEKTSGRGRGSPRAGRRPIFDEEKNSYYSSLEVQTKKIDSAPDNSGQSCVTAWTCCCPIFILLICGVIPLAMVIGSNGTVYLDPYESRKLPTNTFFTKGVQIIDESMKVNTYRFPAEPALNQVLYTQIGETDTIEPNGYKYYSFYLNAGSSASVVFKAAGEGAGAYLGVLRGDQTWAKFKTDPSQVTFLDREFASGSAPQTVSFSNGPLEDNYYFVFFNTDNYHEEDVSFTMNLQRTMYDLFGETQQCTAVVQCTVLFTHGSNEVVIVEAPGDESQPTYALEFKSFTDWGAYYGVFGPILAVFMAIWFSCECCQRCRHRNKLYEDLDGRRPSRSGYGTPPEDPVSKTGFGSRLETIKEAITPKHSLAALRNMLSPQGSTANMEQNFIGQKK